MSTVDARTLMRWQTNLANTAHQREVQDLQAAGLNPVLSAKYGGAAVPSGAMDSSGGSHGSGGGVYSATPEEGGREGFIGGLVDSLPDKGSTRIFGFSVPNKTIKYLYDTGVSTLSDLQEAVTAFAGDKRLGITSVNSSNPAVLSAGSQSVLDTPLKELLATPLYQTIDGVNMQTVNSNPLFNVARSIVSWFDRRSGQEPKAPNARDEWSKRWSRGAQR